MPHRYLAALDTPSVEAAQREYGSHTAMRRLISGWDTDAVLGEDETAFIAARDSFYLATVGETGWPYVQHRGGRPASSPCWARRTTRACLPGPTTAATASTSQSATSVRPPRVAAVHGLRPAAAPESPRRGPRAQGRRGPELTARVSTPDYHARVERIITVRVHGYDWNCPQHITPRWTRAELAPALEKLHTELDTLRARTRHLEQELAALRAR